MFTIVKDAPVRSVGAALLAALMLITTPMVTDALAAEASVDFGGALRYNYYVKSWDGQEANRDKGGDLDLDTIRFEADGTYGDLDISAEYRFYAGYHMLHHGYVGWENAERSKFLFGVHQVPFGIQPYASHNWFFDVGYYVGLEDDYDAGLQWMTHGDSWDLKLGFYKNDEGNYTGNSMDSARYSYDVVNASLPFPGEEGGVMRTNEEVNQFNGRYAYTLDHGDGNNTELGVSGQYGMLYNGTTAEMGSHTAFAAHAVGNYGKFNVMASYMYYTYDLELPEDDPAGDTVVAYGAYDAPYWIAAEGSIALFNVAYASGWSLGPFESLTFYNDYSMLMKSEDEFEDTLQNVLGMSAAAGPLYCYFDVAMGKNHPWIGGSWSYGLATGDPEADWEIRYNINFGYYF
jgi:hypothetical protein